LQRRKSGRDSEECERACNGAGNGNCNGPTDLEKEHSEADEKKVRPKMRIIGREVNIGGIYDWWMPRELAPLLRPCR